MEPDEPAVRDLIRRYAALVARLERELGERPLVLPNSDFFPDPFKGDDKSLRRLVRRMQTHAGMEDIPIRPVLVDAGEEASPKAGSSCSSGACAAPAAAEVPTSRVVDEGDGWRLHFQTAELRHPVVLTATAARALGYVFLMETRSEDEPIEQPVELTVELAAVALGFGELLLEGSHIYAKSCGGPSVARVTALGPEELALAVALFVARGKHSARAIARELPATQREAFQEATALCESNPGLLRALRTDPARIADGHFELGEAKPWLARVLGKKRDAGSLDELESALRAAAEKAPRRPKAADPSRDELRALVDEALTEEARAK